ncbi:MAG: alpha/beta hydrolase [Clostridia bacterium]|nr:alpha/beta hydrolase [Clostridia bacterium]
METTLGKLNIHYEQRGQFPENGRPDVLVLFLHGWGANGASFGRLLDTVGSRYPVLAPDLPGFGGSDEPEDSWSVSDYAAFVLSFLEPFAPKSVILFAHSYGGRISLQLASRTDLPFSVPKMVLVDSAGILPKRGLRYRLKVGFYKAGKKILSWKPVRAVFPNALDEFRAGRGSSDYASASPIMRGALVKAVNEDLTPLLPKVRASTLLIWGEKDTATPLADGRKMENLIPDAGLVVLPEAGHFSYLEQPAVCDAAVRSFLCIPSSGGPAL